MQTSHGDRITPHLYRVAWWDLAGQEAINCDAYALDCGSTVVLIDSGRGGPSYPLMKANLMHWGLWERLSVCLLTHMHRDHSGGVAKLQADGIPVWGSQGGSDYQTDERARTYFEENVPRLDRVWMDGEAFTLGQVPFEVIATPGHTGACAAIFATIDALRCAFTGDMVMPGGTIGYSGSFDFNAQQLRASLERLLRYDFDAVLTGHTLQATQPEGFWLKDGKSHVAQTLQAGLDGMW